MKIEWAIGAIVNGDSKKLQKFWCSTALQEAANPQC